MAIAIHMAYRFHSHLVSKSVDQKDASYESATKPRTSGCWHFLLRQWCLLHGGAPGCVFIPLRTAGVLCENLMKNQWTPGVEKQCQGG